MPDDSRPEFKHRTRRNASGNATTDKYSLIFMSVLLCQWVQIEPRNAAEHTLSELDDSIKLTSFIIERELQTSYEKSSVEDESATPSGVPKFLMGHQRGDYRTWKQSLKREHIFYISKTTGIRVEDIEELENALLSDPEFEEVQVWGFRVNRRFLQAAVEYGH
ncbi:hypothetical protein PUNSTDRAFT_136568 [Punctularia strigosozonata HHB-11173 SS5]|uniref:uncharacterized protein n=1 Tax=Punctularia strigosozonata (strain HHB-11173) TaxID=741275 RepID=UPI000441706D|nr:uncharacterized protein PUNSTDRAFT_136568 [Punctularia strigosozonata HHB-11173 SS5]EIN06730.1 hypothetical protein PUNSTDRAFT_136568 [Punctularia strigosozonata HHB-11173 SS5]